MFDQARLRSAGVLIAIVAVIYGVGTAIVKSDGFAYYGSFVVLIVALAGLAWAWDRGMK